MSQEQIIIDDKGIERAVARMAHEILERNKGGENLVLLGIPARGYELALRLKAKIDEIEGGSVPCGAVDATLYRDDIGLKEDPPALKMMEIPAPIDDKVVVIVDDVFFTGRTIRAAMDALMDFGRASSIQLSVLVDRGHRELPIKPDYVGKNIPTSLEQGVRVRLSECDGISEVRIFNREEKA